MNEKKDRILTIAQKIFSRFGIQKTTMDEISKKARIGKATLYYYFKNKEDIFREVIHKESNILKMNLEEELIKANTPQEKIANYILIRMKTLKRLSNYYENMITSDYFNHYKFIDKERKEFTDYELNIFESILIDGMCENVFTVEDPKETARILITAMKGLEFPFVIQNRSENIEKDIDLLVTILLKGIEMR
jgi:AcrR family transcriptional regulator